MDMKWDMKCKQKRKRIFVFLCGALLCLTALSGCGGSQAKDASSSAKITVEQGVGQTAVPENPQRVVVLDYGALETLQELGLSDRVVGVPQDILPDYLATFRDKKYKNVGNPKTYSMEEISKLQPDLILIGGRQESAYGDLAKIAPTVDMAVDSKDFLASFRRNMETIGKIFHKEDAVEEKVAAIEKKADALREKAAAKDEKGLLLMTTGGKLHGFGEDSHYGLLYSALGLKSVMESGSDSNASVHGETLSYEYIARTDPAYILVIDRDVAIGQTGLAQQLLNNPLVNGTEAAKNGRILYLNPTIWYLSGNGLISVNAMLDEVSKVF